MTAADVLCVGDLDVDLFVAVPRLPGLDEKLAGHRIGLLPGGMAANTAVAFARLGRTARLAAAVGDDAEGARALESIEAAGVDARFVTRRAGARTFTCLILTTPVGEKALIRLDSEAYLPRPEDIPDAAFDDLRHVHATYGDAELAADVLRRARGRGLGTSLDLEPPDIARAPAGLASLLPHVGTLFVNRAGHAAAEATLGRPLTPGGAQDPGALVVTLGAGGSRLIDADGTVEVAGFSVRAVDTTGAGDCFAAAFLARRLEGAPAAEALRFANVAAALSTLAIGGQDAMPSRAAVEARLAELPTERPHG